MRPDLIFENKYFAKEPPLTMAEEKAMDKYVDGVLKVEAPKMEDFDDLYSKEEIRRDVIELEEIKKRLEFKEQHERGLIAAGIFYKEGERSQWFGENTFIELTSEYDDMINHSDLILEIYDGDTDSFDRMAIDVTVSEDPAVLNKKYNFLRKELISGELTDLKYFDSKESVARGKVEGIPRAVVQITKDHLEMLCKNIADKSVNMANHPIQIEITKEIIQSLGDQLAFVNKLNVNRERDNMPQDTTTAQKLEKALNIMRNISRDKEKEMKKRGLVETPRFWRHSLPHFS